MSKIKKALKDLAVDLSTIEVALLDEVSSNSSKVLAYSRTEVEGDSIVFLNEELSIDQNRLFQSMIAGSVKSRAALIKMIISSIT
ncbi:MAG: hypothetical protein JXR03_18415 [Cyclobacteriaceae bacterium]